MILIWATLEFGVHLSKETLSQNEGGRMSDEWELSVAEPMAKSSQKCRSLTT